MSHAVTDYGGQVFSVMVYPLVRLLQSVTQPFNQIASWWHTTRELEAQLSTMRHELEEVRAENIVLCGQRAYWHDIQELLDFKKRYEITSGIIACVIGKHITDEAQYILVDAGSAQDVEPEMVAVFKNIVVGRVAKVYPFYSQVMLVTDHRCRVPARCATTGTQGIHAGMNRTETTRLMFVSHLDKLQLGDTVMTSGQGLIFPAGFGLGTVQHVDTDQLGLTLTVDVTPFLEVHNLKAVVLIRKGIGSPSQLST